MLPGAGVCRAIGVIAAVVLSVSSALAQDDAARIVENFAQDAKRAEARKVEAGLKEADNRRKTEPRKSQESELRKQAAAQYAEAAARRKAAETRAAEEREMLERARQEADEQKATAEIRQLIEEAEAARLRAESVLAENAEQAPDVNTVQTGAVQASAPKSSHEQHKKQAQPAVRRVRESAVADASAAEQARAQAIRTVEHQRRLKHLTRARQVFSARQQAREQRVADERDAQRARDEMVKHALARAEARRAQANLARVVKMRQARAAQAQALASAEAARNQALANAAEEARLEAQARLRVEAEQAQQAAVAALPQAQMNDESTMGEVTAVGSKALSPPAFEGASREAGYRPPVRPEPVAGEPSYAPRREPGVEWNGQVTVLMIMAPGTYGIRRGARTADPVLCTADGCYVSTGSDSPAVFMPRRKALGFGNTFGRRAWACRQQLGCIFRGVPFDYPATLQPVDLHILKHDRRRPQVVLADSHCRIAGHQLMCSRAIRGDDYIMWVVPEGLAERAGPELLERALRGGLNPLRSADAHSAQ